MAQGKAATGNEVVENGVGLAVTLTGLQFLVSARVDD